MVEKLLKAVALGFVNRLLGIVFGVAKIAFIISVILVLVNKANRKYNFLPEEEVEKSILYEPLSDFAPMIFPYLQFDDWKDELEKKKEKKKGKEQKGEKFV
jgi:membrane protein required for colicin V production